MRTKTIPGALHARVVPRRSSQSHPVPPRTTSRSTSFLRRPLGSGEGISSMSRFKTLFVLRRVFGLLRVDLCASASRTLLYIVSLLMLMKAPMKQLLSRARWYHSHEAKRTHVSACVLVKLTRKNTHVKSANELTKIANESGLPTTCKEAHLPFRDKGSHDRSRERADMMTHGGGAVSPNLRLNFTKNTRLIMDSTIGHIYNSEHKFKPKNLQSMETRKHGKYSQHYQRKRLAFARRNLRL